MTPPPPLWPHQEAALEAVDLARAGGAEAGLVVLPTGTGKTGFFITYARRLYDERGGRGQTLVLVHRDELVQQTMKTAARFWPEAMCGVIQGDLNEWDQTNLFTGRPLEVIIASVQSLSAKRLANIPRGLFRLLIADEAHHAPSATWSRALDHFTPDFLLGVTATPARLDGKGLADRFGQRPLYSYSLYQAIKDGHLCNLTPLVMDTRVDLDEVDTSSDGDFSKGKLAAKVNTPQRNAIVLKAFLDHGRGRRAAGFAVDVKHAEDLAQTFDDAGVTARAVHGGLKTSERREILEDFAAGRFRVLWNCEVLTEGWDDPGVDCLLMARPTTSWGLYVQMTGRGLRKKEGKADCLVLDFADNTRRHSLMKAVNLMGREPREGEPEEEDSLEGRARPRKPKKEVRILEWRMSFVCPWPELPSLAGYVPTMTWQEAPATPKQVKYLESYGVKTGGNLTAGEVSYLIDRARELDAAFPAPPSQQQIYFLRRRGLWREGLTRKDAQRLIGQAKRLERKGAG